MLKTPLHAFHESAGGKMVDFAGWEMPVYYRSITDEHRHTRSRVSLFDVSHMGRLRVDGDRGLDFLNYICTRDLSAIQVGQSKYSHICREDGGILDDVIVSRHVDHMVVICNASNREKIVAWLTRHAPGYSAPDSPIDIVDETLDTAMLAVQGPNAIKFMESAFGLQLSDLKRYWFVTGDAFGLKYTVYRSGYTGEDGVEAILPASAVPMLLPQLFGHDLAATGDCKPAGLGARDTLRLEAGMPLYGHELTEDVDSISAGQAWCVQLDHDFIGADAMRKVKADGAKRKMIGLELEGKRIARQGYEMVKDGRVVGVITSGTMSPTLDRSIAMGFIDAEFSEPGTEVEVDLGRKTHPARIVPLPFYKRPK